MKKHRLSIVVTLILLTFIAIRVPAEVDSVLSVIPQDAVGVIYVQSLLGLNHEINTLLAEMVPSDPPQEVIAKALANAFGAGFESLEELEELGFDLNKNFAIFLAGTNPPIPSAAVHITDPEPVKQLIEAQSQVGSSVAYNEMTYYTTGEGRAFVLLDDVLVYSGTGKICENAIDAYKRAMPSIRANIDYASLKLDTTSGDNDLVAYFAMEPIVEAIRPALLKKSEEMKSGMQAQVETNPQLASGLGLSQKVIDGGIRLLEQAKTLSLTFQLNGSDLQISPFLKFKSDSEIQERIRTAPMELTQLKYLPQTAFLNGDMRFQKEDFIRFTRGMLKLFTPADANADKEQVEKAFQEYTQVITSFCESLGDTMSVSVNFSDSLMPDVLYIYDAPDEGKIKSYMNGYLTYLESVQSVYEAMGAAKFNIFDKASAGAIETYNGVEIKSYTLPNVKAAFTQLPPQAEGLAPKQWNIYYAIKGGKLLYSMSANAQSIKAALERMAGTGIGFDKGAGYDKLTHALTLTNNMLIGISPLTAVKNIVQLVAQTNPDVGMVMMLLGSIPEAYSIGIASQNRDGGVEGKLFISLGDFKDLINMAASMQGEQ
ncbi:hypothetical protein HYR99_29090 [Candidatus Poribacteria bacterium]|nr:hypothetical protein [Candidatus Poribacteria bacterium]